MMYYIYLGLIETEITVEAIEVVVAEVAIEEAVIIFVEVVLIDLVYVVEVLSVMSEVL